MESEMKSLLFVTLVASALVSVPALANPDLAKAKNCMTCHAIDKKVLGPAFKDVSAKYAGKKDAETYLSQKIMKGSMGVWGNVPMPPNAVSEKEAEDLSKWIISIK